MAYTVKAVAELAGVSVRTLHHYDAIGLLRPGSLSTAGYRLYDRPDLERLQQVLFFRELGFALPEIKAVLDRPDFDRTEALRRHRQLLSEQRVRIDRLITSIDLSLKTSEGGVHMDDSKLFDGFDQSKYEEEARQRWGTTDAYRQSRERASRYTAADWAAIQAESRAIEAGLAALVGRDPADPEVQALVARHHGQINDRFYTCSPEMYRGLGAMYIDDPRFAAHYESIRPGLAAFLRTAIEVFCDAATK